MSFSRFSIIDADNTVFCFFEIFLFKKQKLGLLKKI